MEHYYSQQVLERYDIPDARLAYRFAEMQHLGLEKEFFFVLLNMFEDDACSPERDLSGFSLATILDYISRTHKYYLSKKLPEMEQSIELLLLDYADGHPLLPALRLSFSKYKADLTKHIGAEEKFVMPHIRRLIEASEDEQGISGLLSKGHLLRNFIESHTDTEGDLRLVRDILRRYEPPTTNQTPYRILLTQLQMFEKDLSVHAAVEDLVLIPRAMELEDSLMERLNAGGPN